VESYLVDLSSLLLLGILLGCHYLAFRDQARNPLGRALQRAGKLRLLGVCVLAPLSLFLWLQGESPITTIVVNQVILYWTGSTLFNIIWLLRREREPQGTPTPRDWRPPVQVLWLSALILQAGWQQPEYRDVAYATAATALLGLLLLRIHRKIFRSPLPSQWLSHLQRRLVYHGYLLLSALSGYFLIRAWTIVPITSGQLRLYENLLGLLLALIVIEGAAVSLEHLLRSQRRSEEMAHLASDGFRAVVYCGLALVLSTQGTHRELALSSAFFSIGLGFALKPTLGNFVSGLIQRVSQDFFIGDFVHIGPVYGMITNIDWRTVSIGTLTHDTITLPHSQVAKSVLINYTRPSPRHAVYLELQLSRLTPPGVVRRTVLEILSRLPEVLQEPAPEVYLMDLNGSGLTYRIRWWLDHVNQRFTYESEVQRQLIYGMERAQLRPIFPIKRLELAETEESVPQTNAQ